MPTFRGGELPQEGNEMQTITPTSFTSDRAAALFDQSLNVVHRRADRLFAWLMIAQWIAGIAAALWISPQTWLGAASQTHWHVWAAIFLGGALTGLPVYFAYAMPGRALTRHTIAVAQMLFSAVLIHLTGGRIETHFHVFGSLAFLAFYRDWRVLLTATVVVAVDHATRGMLFPQSVFGILTASPWRWIEHAGWVLFEDFFLFISIHQSTRDMSAVAAHRADLEAGGEQRLAQAQQMAHIGSWEWNVRTDEIIWSDEEYRLFGFAPRTLTPTYDLCLESVHPDDRSLTAAWIKSVLVNKKPCVSSVPRAKCALCTTKPRWSSPIRARLSASSAHRRTPRSANKRRKNFAPRKKQPKAPTERRANFSRT